MSSRTRLTDARKHSLGPKAAIVVLLFGLRVWFRVRFQRLGRQNLYRIFISRIDISFLRRHRNFDFVLVLAGTGNNAEVSAHFIVALRSP